MDDPAWSWPAWKFGMKRDDLFTRLHDQYNTFTFTIQDPEAFHHDVYEISRDAETTADFHRLMADRQRQRLEELHQSLESLAVEIIANPKLMDSEHWQYALQLFRTKSFDSIVRYFASYLPDEYLDRHDNVSISSSFSDTHSVKTASTTASSVDDTRRFFSEEAVMTKEPLYIHTNIPSTHVVGGPLSPPRSEADVSSESHPSSPTELESHEFCSRTHSHSMSFSGSDSEPFAAELNHVFVHDEDDISQTDDSDAAISSAASDCGASTISDAAESRSSLDTFDGKEEAQGQLDDEDEFPSAQFPEDAFDVFDTLSGDDMLESDTPTPHQEPIASCYVEYKSVMSQRAPSSLHRRPPSPSPKPLSTYRREGLPLKEIRRSPDESLSKIQKPLSFPRRNRPKDRRRLD